MDRLMIDFYQAVNNNKKINEIKQERSDVSISKNKRIYKTEKETPTLSFEDILTQSVKKVNTLQLEAEKKVRDLAIGDVEDISEVVLASSRADTALRLMMEVRNKFLDAYQALSRITG